MNQRPNGLWGDAVARRRNYVRRKAHALAIGAVGSLVVIVCGCAGPYGLWISWTQSGSFEAFLSSLLSLLLFGAMVFQGIRLFNAARQKAQSLTYVPPVHQQIAALPFDRVLLRGAEQSAAEPSEMLRAASGTETGGTELMRVWEAGRNEEAG